jgi:hypothetical protein
MQVCTQGVREDGFDDKIIAMYASWRRRPGVRK